VHPNGTGNGSKDKPWGIEDFNNGRNWGSGAGKISAGDTVIFENGTYTRSGKNTAVVELEAGGARGARITIKARNKWGAVIDCANDESFGISGSAAPVNQRHYWNIENFEIKRCVYNLRFRDDQKEGGDDTHNIAIRNNYIHTSKGSGLAVGYGAHDIVIEKNLFENIGTSSAESAHGIYATGYNFLIRNNIFHRRPSTAGYHIKVDGYQDGGRGQSFGKIINNTFAGSVDGRAAQIYIGNSHGTYFANAAVIRNNVFYDVDPGKNDTAIINKQTLSSGWVFTNNVTDAANIVGGNGNHSSAKFNSNTTGLSSARLTSEFLNPSRYNYRLTGSGSYLVDKGNGSYAPKNDYDGNSRDASPDIGAFEYQTNVQKSNEILPPEGLKVIK
jgi:hypothetical protein